MRDHAGQPARAGRVSSAGRTLQQSLNRALESADIAPELAPGIERSMNRAFWSRSPLAAHADARVIAALPIAVATATTAPLKGAR